MLPPPGLFHSLAPYFCQFAGFFGNLKSFSVSRRLRAEAEAILVKKSRNVGTLCAGDSLANGIILTKLVLLVKESKTSF